MQNKQLIMQNVINEVYHILLSLNILMVSEMLTLRIFFSTEVVLVVDLVRIVSTL